MQFIDDKEVYYKYLYHHCHCVNAGQSKEERQMKYKLALYFGCSVEGARKYRDWNYNTFAKKFGFRSWDLMIKGLKND